MILGTLYKPLWFPCRWWADCTVVDFTYTLQTSILSPLQSCMWESVALHIKPSAIFQLLSGKYGWSPVPPIRTFGDNFWRTTFSWERDSHVKQHVTSCSIQTFLFSYLLKYKAHTSHTWVNKSRELLWMFSRSLSFNNLSLSPDLFTSTTAKLPCVEYMNKSSSLCFF